MRGLRWVCLLLLVFTPGIAFGLSGKGTTAASFLKVGIGSRAVALGESYVAIADDASAVYWNPAGLTTLDNPELMAMHIFWLDNMYFEQVAGALPVPVGTAGAALVYLNSGGISRSESGDVPEDPDRGQFTVSDIGFTGAWGYPFSQTMSLGAGLVVFSENIDAQANIGWALNLGFLYRLPWAGWTLGAQVQNLGPATRFQDEYFRLPINFKLGAAYQPFEEFLCTLEYNQLLEQGGKISLGAEYVYEKIMALRVGYKYQEKVDNEELYNGFGNGMVSGLTAGLGLIYRQFRLDYAFVPYGFLGSTHRISLTYLFTQWQRKE